MSRRVDIQAPARLHAGLLRPGLPAPGRSGGLGLFIDRPAAVVSVTALSLSSSEGTSEKTSPIVRGPYARRLVAWGALWQERRGLMVDPGFSANVRAAPPAHSGLGLGTQLALALGTALDACFTGEVLSPYQYASWFGRGRRSYVGVAGFRKGGIVFDPGDPPLGRHRSVVTVPLPAAWRVLLPLGEAPSGPFGAAEERLFSRLPAEARASAGDLVALAEEVILPAIGRADFDAFSEGLAAYGDLASRCFRSVQNGRYNGPAVVRRAERLRAAGAPFVLQSSWGPTVFTVCPNARSAGQLREALCREAGSLEAPPAGDHWMVAKPSRGARWTVYPATALSDEPSGVEPGSEKPIPFEGRPGARGFLKNK